MIRTFPVGVQRSRNSDEFADLAETEQIVRGDIIRFGIYLVLSLYSGMQDSGIDNTAHLSGAVIGFILCGVLYRRKNKTDIRIGGY